MTEHAQDNVNMQHGASYIFMFICLTKESIFQSSLLTPSYIEIKMGYENHVYLAKLAEQAERYEGMVA